MVPQSQPVSFGVSSTGTIPELQQSKIAALNTLASRHSWRSYQYAIERFIVWYCSEPRLTFNCSVVVKYRSFPERLSLIRSHHQLASVCRSGRLADESAESGWLSPELAIGIGVLVSQASGTENGQLAHPQSGSELANAASKTDSTRLE